MYTFIIILIAIIAVLLILVVLLQSSKGGGLAGIAGGGASQILGARQTADVLERATWTLGGLFLALCILSNFAINRGGGGSALQERLQEQPAQQEQTLPPLPVPQQENQEQGNQ